MARVIRKKRGKGGSHTVKSRRKKVTRWKSRNGKASGYTVVKRPRRGKNKKIIVKKVKVKRR